MCSRWCTTTMLLSLASTLLARTVVSPVAPPAPADPFAHCGNDESGIEGTGGELNTPFGTHPYCCGNTTWSSFSWRAKASPNVPVSSDLRPARGSGQSNASWCIKEGPDKPSSFDCFIFYINASSVSAGGGAAAGYNGHNYSETRAAGEWTNWREFLPDAPTLQHDGTMPATGGTVGAYHCYAYPNFYMDPIRHLVVPLTVHGVYRGNMSTITIEVKPGGAKAGLPTYQLNATVSGLGNARTPMSIVNVPLVVTRENLTEADGGPVRPLMTEREKHSRLWSALPKIPRAPQKILIKQGFHGGNDIGDWQDAARALVGMGASAISAPPSAAVAKIFKKAGVTAAGLEGGLRPNYEMEYSSPVRNFSTDCGKASSDVDHCWGSTDSEVQANLKLWADGLITPMRKAGFEQLTQFALHDELGYNFATVGVTDFSGSNNITHNPRVFARFHSYICNMSGLNTPQDFGATSWSDVIPMTRRNLTTAAAAAQSAVIEQGLRVRYYWTMRFVAWDVETWYAKATAALVAANDGKSFSIYTNWNNFHGRLYSPQCAGPPTPANDCKPDYGSMDWFEAGRLRAGTMLWTEDWFGDSKASEWTYLAARLRSAAKLGGPAVQFGGYIVPRGPTGGVAHGTVGLLKKAIALVGSGASAIDWFEFGPEDTFPGNCWSAIGLHETNHSTFKYIAEASRMIAEVEDILAPGTMPVSKVAILYPRSAWLWDNASGGVYGPVGPHGTEDQGATAMDYMAVIAGLFRMIQQQNNILVDIIDEDSLTAEVLAHHSALIVTEPDLPAEGLKAVLTWVKEEGGHLLTVPGAAAYDRYHQPSTQLPEATGITEAPRQRLMIDNAARLVPVANATGDLGEITAFGPPGHLNLGTGLSQVTVRPGSGAVVVAKFGNGTPAIVHNPTVGKGSATHFAFMPCIHFNEIDPFKPQHHFNNVTNFTDGSEVYVLHYLTKAGVRPRVQLSNVGQPGAPIQVETPLIVSTDGAVLTLLNWRESPIEGMNVSVALDFDIHRVMAVRAMATANEDLDFTSAARADGTFVVQFRVARLEHSDFVKLLKK